MFCSRFHLSVLASFIISLMLATVSLRADQEEVFIEPLFEDLPPHQFQIANGTSAGLRWIFFDTGPECRVFSIHERTGEFELLFASPTEQCRSHFPFWLRGPGHGAPFALYETNVLDEFGNSISKEIFVTDGTVSGTSQITDSELVTALHENWYHESLPNGKTLFTHRVTQGDITTTTFREFQPDGSFRTVASTTEFFPVARTHGDFVIRNDEEIWFVANPDASGEPRQIGRLEENGFIVFPLSAFGLSEDDSFSRLIESDGKLFLFDNVSRGRMRMSMLDPDTMTGTVLKNFTNLPTAGEPWRWIDNNMPSEILKIGDYWVFDMGDADTGRRMWMTDGTGSGTVLLANHLNFTESFRLIGVTQDRIIFLGYRWAHPSGWRLYGSTTTPSSAVVVGSVENPRPNPVQRVGPTSYGDRLIVNWFGTMIYSTDGTENSLEPLGDGSLPGFFLTDNHNDKSGIFIKSLSEIAPNTLYRLSYRVFSADFE